MLLLNFFRDIRHTLPRLLSVVIVTALGVMIFIGLSGLDANLRYIINVYVKNANEADIWITANNADARDIAGLNALPSVAAAQPRVTLSTKWNANDEVNIKLHTFNESVLCIPYIVQGRAARNARECMLASSFADAHGLNVGDKITLRAEDELLTFTICALIVSPEYVYNISGMDLMPNPAKNGFLYVREQALQTSYGKYIYNDIVIRGVEGVDSDTLIKNVKTVLKERCLGVLKYKDNIRAYMLYDELDQMSSMTTTLPSLFFLTAALIMFTTMQRVVENNRTMIGTLKALGYTDTRILVYFLSYALIVIVIGTVLGSIPGRVITAYFMDMIFSLFELPPVPLQMNWASLWLAVAIASFCCFGSVLLTAIREVRSGPAECMRPKPPKRSRRNIIERSPLWRVLGFSAKTVIRNIFRNRMRAVMCVVGVSMCMALIVTALGMSDTTNKMMSDLYEKLYRYDLQVALKRTPTEREARHLTRLPGITRAESEMDTPVEASLGGKKSDTSVHAVEDILTLMVIDVNAGSEMVMPTRGVYVAKSLADELGVSLGDRITFKLIGTRRSYELPVSGVAANIAGIYISKSLWRSLGEGFSPDMLYLLATDSESVKAELADNDDLVLSVKPKQEVVDAVSTQMSTMNAMIAILILFGGVLAFVVLYSLGIMNFYDRMRDLATLCVLGFYPREIRTLILSENMVFTVFGVVLGSLLGAPLLNSLLTNTSMGDLSFEPLIKPLSYAIAALLTLFYAIIVNALLGRKTKKIDMLGALKSVE